MADIEPKHTASTKRVEDVIGEIPAAPHDAHGAHDISVVNKAEVLRKLDLRILPVVTILYLAAFIDRGNIGNARILGMEKELGLVGNQFQLALTVFFFPYCAFEIPSNILLKRLRPSIWLPSIMIAWGVVTLCTGFVQNYTGLLIARIFLGVGEAGLFPGVAFYLTFWYAPEDLAFRQGIFFSAASAAGAFSGLLAYAINKMDGLGGQSGWRWIFIVEGAATIALALVAFFCITDSPDRAKYLTDTQRAWVVERVKYTGSRVSERGRSAETHEKFQWKHLTSVLMDLHIWLAILGSLGAAVVLYGISFFLPSIIRQLGYTANAANLLTIPMYVSASIATVVVSWFSDHVRLRYPFILAMQIVVLVGFLLCTAGSAVGDGSKLPGLKYTGVFLATLACFPGNIVLLTWVATNYSPTYRRGIALALQIGMGNMGGAMASNFYRQKDAPGYLLGHGLELGFVALAIIGCGLLRFSYGRINRKRDENENDTEAYTDAQLADLGDRAPTFRYNL